jgi:hypothetical protein
MQCHLMTELHILRYDAYNTYLTKYDNINILTEPTSVKNKLCKVCIILIMKVYIGLHMRKC